LNVTFTPAKTETLSGSVTVTSNASNSPTKIAVAGDGVAAGPYSVSLHWTASTSSGIVGYNVYRALPSSTTYSKLNASPMSGTSYVDSLVTAGESYTYHVTAVNSQGEESAPSLPVSATIP
jgi:fibronectin type 3 domain-containing protein